MFRDPRYGRASLVAHEEYLDLLFAKFRRDRETRQAASFSSGRPFLSSCPPPRPALPSPAPASAADLEFDRVRSAALARLAAEQEAQRAEEAAATAILDAYHGSMPTGAALSAGHNGDERAASLSHFHDRPRAGKDRRN